MVEAKALFKRHFDGFRESMLGCTAKTHEELLSLGATIYAACILVEAIKNEEPVEAKYCPRCAGGLSERPE